MGDGDCPDWVLSTISTVTAMSSLKFKIFVKNVVDGILDNKVDVSKNFRHFPTIFLFYDYLV